jgi:hypothetical protein
MLPKRDSTRSTRTERRSDLSAKRLVFTGFALGAGWALFCLVVDSVLRHNGITPFHHAMGIVAGVGCATLGGVLGLRAARGRC